MPKPLTCGSCCVTRCYTLSGTDICSSRLATKLVSPDYGISMSKCSRSVSVVKFKAQTAFASDSNTVVEQEPRVSKPNLWIIWIIELKVIILENIQDTLLTELQDRKNCSRLKNEPLELLWPALILLIQYHTQEPRAGCWERMRLINILDLISVDHPDFYHTHRFMEPSLKLQCTSVATGLREPFSLSSGPAAVAHSNRFDQFSVGIEYPGPTIISPYLLILPRKVPPDIPTYSNGGKAHARARCHGQDVARRRRVGP